MSGDLYSQIGERLRKQRGKMGISQREAAQLLGMSTTYYGEIERGCRKLTIARVLEVYEKMGLEPTYLLTGRVMTDKAYHDIFKDCPREKERALEQVLKSIAQLY
ncbi:MAG: helix-turn-helix transcriptional regulator [Eubacteriales bacterium]|nr:helix-turn-helix transcriptional regulator [Eubacteriales bacterium]